MTEDDAARVLAQGIIPIGGLEAGLEAIRAAQACQTRVALPIWTGCAGPAEVLSEHHAKVALARFGVPVPAACVGPAEDVAHWAEGRGPVVLKVTGQAHKTDSGGVALDLSGAEAVTQAARAMGSGPFLVEEMVSGAVAELLVGVTRDPAHGFLLTLGAGGTLTELWRDTVTALRQLRIWPLLAGYRGAPAEDLTALVQAIAAVQWFVGAHLDQLQEVEINPLIVTPDRAVAVDALIRGDVKGL